MDSKHQHQEVPERVGPYALGARLGSGGTAVVHEATDESGAPVALKLIRQRETGRRARMLIERFLRETEALQRLKHPSMVRLLGAGADRGYVYLAMERIQGADLQALLARGALSFETVVWLGLKLSQVLLRCHGAGVIHRDIKPSNILIQRNGDPKLIDFGIATFEGATNITRQNDILGTLGYIAPEVLDGERATCLSDQYSLGRVLLSLSMAPPVRFASNLQLGLAERLLEGLSVDWRAFPRGGSWSALQIVLQRMVSERPEDRLSKLAGPLSAMRTLWGSTGLNERDPRALLASRVARVARRAPVDQRAIETLVVRRPTRRNPGARKFHSAHSGRTVNISGRPLIRRASSGSGPR